MALPLMSPRSPSSLPMICLTRLLTHAYVVHPYVCLSQFKAFKSNMPATNNSKGFMSGYGSRTRRSRQTPVRLRLGMLMGGPWYHFDGLHIRTRASSYAHSEPVLRSVRYMLMHAFNPFTCVLWQIAFFTISEGNISGNLRYLKVKFLAL